MIKMTIQGNQQQVNRIEIKGHADAGPYGSDIVCAAVSALAISLVNGLQEVVDVPEPKVTSDETNGGLLIIEEISQQHDAQLVTAVIVHGLSAIAQQYATYITINNETNLEV